MKPFLLSVQFTDPRDASRHAEDVANALDAFDTPAIVREVKDPTAANAAQMLAALKQLLAAAVMAPQSVRQFPPFALGERMADEAIAQEEARLGG